MVLPPHDLPEEMIEEVRDETPLAKALKVIGLMVCSLP